MSDSLRNALLDAKNCLLSYSDMRHATRVMSAVDRINAALKEQAADAEGPLDCPGVKGMPFTHLFLSHRGEPPYCARCGLLEADYKQEGLVAGGDGGSAAAAAPIARRQSLPPALQDWLSEVEAFLQDQHDIRDGAGGQQLPNKAMSLSIALKEALGERPWA